MLSYSQELRKRKVTELSDAIKHTLQNYTAWYELWSEKWEPEEIELVPGIHLHILDIPRLLNTLPPQQMLAVQLVLIQGRSETEAGKLMGISGAGNYCRIAVHKLADILDGTRDLPK